MKLIFIMKYLIISGDDCGSRCEINVGDDCEYANWQTLNFQIPSCDKLSGMNIINNKRIF